jgi:hypothetical protein
VEAGRTRRLLILLPTASLALFLAAERLNLLRTDSIAAAACSRELFRSRPDEAEQVARHEAAISDAAAEHDLPPEMLAAVIVGHQTELTASRRFSDCAGSALGFDLSLGMAQVRISTAMRADGVNPDAASPGEFKTYRSALLVPARNVHYEAKELRQILEQAHRSPGVAAETLIRDPATMTAAMSEYRVGRVAPHEVAVRRGLRGLVDLRYLLEPRIYVFDRDDADAAQVRQDVSDFLEQTYCRSGTFNDSACAWWRSWAPDPTS